MFKATTNHIALLCHPGSSLNFKSFFGEETLQRAAVFSEGLIKKLVEEEAKRDTSVILKQEGQWLHTMSSGERKVAVFNYILSQNPTFLIVENFYDNLDPRNKKKLEKLIFDFSISGSVLQVVRKKNELFEWISEFNYLEKNELIPYLGKLDDFFNKTATYYSEFKTPSTTTNYNYNYKTFVKLVDVEIKFFEKVVLKKINWEIKLGEFWQLIGENGSGKTTLLSLITGDSHKAYGQQIVLFDKLKGTEENVWEIKQKIGYFTPNITELFNRRHSVLHMILSGFYDSIGLYVKPLESHIKLAHQWLGLLGLSELSNKTFLTLTLSQQRMILIARAMVKHPPLLILDEPTSGLDEQSTQLIVALINKIASESKTTVIYVSHTLEKGLSPDKTFKLTKTSSGSIGEIIT